MPPPHGKSRFGVALLIQTLRTAVLALALTGACADPPPPLIAYAAGPGSIEVIRVAREELATRDSSRAIRIWYDSLIGIGQADVEVQRAEKIVSLPGLVSVVGHNASRGSLVAAPIYNDAGIPMVVPTGTSRLLEDAGPWTMMLAPSDSAEGRFICEFVQARFGAPSITIFFVTDEYGIGLRDGVATACTGMGIRIGDEVAFSPGSDLELLVQASLRRSRPGMVFIAGRPGETTSIKRSLDQLLPGTPVITGDGAFDERRLREFGSDVLDGLYAVAFWLPIPDDSLSAAFIERFQRLNGRIPGASEAMARDCLMVVAHAIDEAGPSPGRVRDYLMELGRSRPAYSGVTGPVMFGPGRPDRMQIVGWSGGRLAIQDFP